MCSKGDYYLDKALAQRLPFDLLSSVCRFSIAKMVKLIPTRFRKWSKSMSKSFSTAKRWPKESSVPDELCEIERCINHIRLVYYHCISQNLFKDEVVRRLSFPFYCRLGSNEIEKVELNVDFLSTDPGGKVSMEGRG